MAKVASSSPRSQTLLGEIARYFPASIAPALGGFLLVPILTRMLPTSQYGVVSLVGATVSVVEAVAVGWLTNAVIRFYVVAARGGGSVRFVAATAAVTTASALAAAAITAVAVFQLTVGREPGVTWIGAAAAGLVASGCFVDVGLATLRGGGRSSLYSLGSTLRALLRVAGCVLGGSILPDRLVGVIVGWFAAWCLTATYTMAMATRSARLDVDRLKSHTDHRDGAFGWRSMAAYGVPVSASLVLSILLSDGDRFILQWLTNSAQVGIYSAVYVIANGSLAIIYPLPMTAAYPMLVRLWETPGERPAAGAILNEATRHFLRLAVPGAAGLIALAAPLLRVLSTPTIATAANVMVPVALGALMLGAGQYSTVGILLARQPIRLTWMLFAAMAANLGLNLLLIPVLGLLGAGIATLLAYGLYAGLGLILGRRYLTPKLDVWSVLKIVGAAVVMGLLVGTLGRLMRPSLLDLALLVALGVVAYGLMLALLGELDLRN